MKIPLGRMRSILMVFPIFVAAFLSGCGSSGGDGTTAAAPAAAASTMITGTAAAGAPIIGTVSVSDSSTNPQPVKAGIPIAADGKYSVDVSGLKAPFAFLADGTVGNKRVQMYSAAVQADVGGTINITPFTDLIVRNIAGSIATTLADAIASKLSTLTAAELDAKRIDLTNKLTPILQAAGVSASIDLLRAAFTADATDTTGLDRFMDLVKVDTTVPTAVTITNILDAAHPLTVDTATGTSTGGTTLSATGVTTAATPVDGIMQTFKTFGSLFATSLPSPTDPALLALFSTTFKDGGKNIGAFLTEITTDNTIIGVKFANGIVVDSIDTAAGTAKVHFNPVSSTGVSLAHDMVGGALNMQMTKVGANWLMDGDQRIATVRVRTSASRLICNTGSMNGCTAGTTAKTGVDFWIDNKGMINIGSAVVTGPGLPAGGVTLTAQVNQTSLQMPLIGCSGCTTSTYTMTDANIGAMGTGPYTYTVNIFSNAATPALLATYTEVVPVAPVLNTALAALAFPSITSTVNNLAGFAGGTLTPAWTIPAGLWGDVVNADVWQQSSSASPGPNQFVQADLGTKTATSGTSILVIAAPATGVWTFGNYWINAWDQYGGMVNTSYQ